MERFDRMVVDSLEGRPLTGVRATAELEPADKGKPLLPAVGAIAAVCVLREAGLRPQRGIRPGVLCAPGILEELVDHYRTTNQFTDLETPERLTAWRSGDGVECQVADLTNCNAASHTQWTFQKRTA